MSQPGWKKPQYQHGSSIENPAPSKPILRITDPNDSLTPVFSCPFPNSEAAHFGIACLSHIVSLVVPSNDHQMPQVIITRKQMHPQQFSQRCHGILKLLVEMMLINKHIVSERFSDLLVPGNSYSGCRGCSHQGLVQVPSAMQPRWHCCRRRRPTPLTLSGE